MRALLVAIVGWCLLAGEVRAAPVDPTLDLVPIVGGWQERTAEGAWEDVVFPSEVSRTPEDGNEVRHLRRVLQLADGAAERARQGAYALAIGFGGVSYEVRVDGVVVGRHGVLSAPGRAFGFPEAMRTTAFDLPAETFADGVLQIDLTMEQPQLVHDRPLGRGVQIIGPREAVAAAVRASNLDYQLRHVVPLLMMSAICVAVGLFHVMLWWRRRELEHYLWFAGYVFGVAGVAGSIGVLRAGWYDHQLRADAMVAILSGLLLTFGVGFTHRLTRRRPPEGIWRGFTWLGTAWAIVMLVPLVAPAMAPGMLTLAVLPGLVPPFVLVFLAAVSGNRAARILVLGFLMAMGIAASLFWVDAKSPWAPMLAILAILTIIASMAVSLADRYARDLDTLDATRRAALRFVPGDFLRMLGRDEVLAARRGDAVRIEGTVMFSDIVGFTTLAETMTAEQVFTMINHYLGVMQPIIHRHGGVVASYMGDGIMAFFPRGPRDALDAALAQLEALEEVNAGIGPELVIGLGFHHGPVVLGTLGGPDHLECTPIGDSVNLAARVEGITRMHRTPVLCTDAVVRALGDDAGRFQLREVDLVRAKGKEEPVALFELVDALPVTVQEGRRLTAQAFANALATWRLGELPQAAAAFEDCLLRAPHDGAARLFLERCAVMAKRTMPQDWDGVWRVERK